MRTKLAPLLRLTFALSLLLPCIAYAGDVNDPKLAPPFDRLVPQHFEHGPLMVELKRINPGASFREVDVGAPEKPQKARVSVRDGVRAMYAYPNERFYANVKTELSAQGMYALDRENVLQAMTRLAETERRKGESAADVPAVSRAREAAGAAGLGLVESGSAYFKGFQYHYVFSNTLSGQGQVHIFVPRHEAIVSIYLLGRKESEGATLATTRAARQAFIEAYIEALKD